MNLKILKILLLVFCVIGLVIVAVPSWRSLVRDSLIKETPIILSTIRSDFFRDGRSIVFAKVKTGENIFLEIYEEVVDGYQKQLGRLRLPDKNDGFFHYRGQATNLALEDLTGDGLAEVLAPSFDANHVAHLNVYTYNSATQQFEPMPPGEVNY